MISLYDVLEAADGQLFGEAEAQIFSDFSIDARESCAGKLYVALKTERGDGHHTMADAVANGATGIMCTHPPTFDTEGLTVIVMRSVEDALLRWARLVLEKYGTTVVGVAGAVGKTTTTAAIAQVLGTHFKVYTHPGGIRGKFGLPLALGRLTKDYQIAILEFGACQAGEMGVMVSSTKPMVGVVTAIGQTAHEQLGNPDNVAQEIGELLRALPPEGLAVLNFDDPLARALAPETQAAVMTVGLDLAEPAFGSDLLAYNILVDRYKTGFDLRRMSERYPGRWIPLLGAHQLYSALAALAVGMSYQIPLEEGLHALTELEPLPGRMHPLDGLNGSLLIDDSFSANPASVQAALDWLKSVREEQSRVIVVMGDMDEPASATVMAHIQVGQRISEVVDRLITEGDLAAEVGRAALDYHLERSAVTLTFSAEDAAKAASLDLGPDDIVLVKGGPSAHMERVVERLLANPEDTAHLVRQTSVHQAVPIEQPDRPSWVRIDLEAMAYNVRRVKEIVGSETALMAVVKTNAYGHGAVAASTTALNNGAALLGVASLSEAIELRAGGIAAPILILGYTPAWAAREIIRHNLTISLYDADLARAFDRAARDQKATISAHVVIDTGLGMLGLLPEEVTLFFRSLRNFKNLEIEGIYTELAASDHNFEYTRVQVATFEGVVEPLLAAGFRFKYIHAANSAAAIHMAEARFNLVRSGIALYGLTSSLAAPLPADFKPVLEWRTTVAQVKRLPPGSAVGYGSSYRTSATQRIAILPVGYGDGFRRSPARWKHVLIRGEYAPVIGQIGMDMTAADVTPLGDDVKIGEEVVLIGRQGERQITVEDVADYLDTNVYEVVSTVLARVPRVK